MQTAVELQKSQLAVWQINLHCVLLLALVYPLAQLAQVVVEEQVSQLEMLQALLHAVPPVFLTNPVAQTWQVVFEAQKMQLETTEAQVGLQVLVVLSRVNSDWHEVQVEMSLQPEQYCTSQIIF